MHGAKRVIANASRLDPSGLRGRRLWLVAAAAAVLAACSPQGSGDGRVTAGRFHAIDVTGADYGTDFRLADPQGRERTLADFRGKAVLLFFGFTQCPDVCPTALSRAVEVMRLLGDDGTKVQVLFATVDPERDTAELLQAYTTTFHPSFIGLRTDLERTRETAKHFKVFFAKVPTGSSYTMDHTAMTYAFDPQGRLRLAIRHSATAREVADDVGLLLKGR
jgi:protein SCO1/2